MARTLGQSSRSRLRPPQQLKTRITGEQQPSASASVLRATSIILPNEIIIKILDTAIHDACDDAKAACESAERQMTTLTGWLMGTGSRSPKPPDPPLPLKTIFSIAMLEKAYFHIVCQIVEQREAMEPKYSTRPWHKNCNGVQKYRHGNVRSLSKKAKQYRYCGNCAIVDDQLRTGVYEDIIKRPSLAVLRRTMRALRMAGRRTGIR